MLLMVWSTHAKDAKILLGIPSPTKHIINNQLALDLVDNSCLDNMLQIVCKFLPYFAKNRSLTTQKFQNFQCSTSK